MSASSRRSWEGPWEGGLALILALAVQAVALAGCQPALHLGGFALLPLAEPIALLDAALAVGAALLALRGLRLGGRPGAWPAALALALLSPFAAEVLLAPFACTLPNGAPRRAAFLLLSAAGALGALRLGQRAARRGPPPGPPTPFARAARRWAARGALAAGTLAVLLVAAELALGAAGVGERRYARPLLILPGDGRRMPLSEIALFVPFGPPPPGTFSSRFRPYVFFKGWYDRPRWSYFDAQGQVAYVFNRHGLRDHDFELLPAPDEYRVVAAGDSFTFGAGVPLDLCWPEVLERNLREHLGRPVEVINAGFASGNHPGDYEPWLIGNGVRLQPDVVVVGLCLNDLHKDVSLFGFRPRRLPPQPLAGRSHLLNAWQESRLPPDGPAEPIDWTVLVAAEPEQWEANRAALRRTHEALEARGIRLVVAILPMLSGLRGEYPYEGLHHMVAEACASDGLECVDLLPRFLGLVDEDLWVHPTDQHPNDVGHRIIAEGVEEYLRQPR